MFRIAGITSKGFDVLAEALSGKTLSFTRMEYGSGILPGLENIVADSETLEKYKEFIKENPEPTEQQILEMLRTEATDLETKTLILDVESLVSKKGDIGLYEAVSDNGITTLTGKVVDSSVSVDFRARELGVYAQVEEGEEVLFAYFSAVDFLSGEIRDSSDFISIPALLGQEQVIKVNIATGQAAKIDMKYNLNIYATKKEFDETVAKIKNQIAIEVSNIIAEAPESFDTLKEISDWIATHVDSAAAMNSKIVQNQNDIKALKNLVGNIAGYVPVGTLLHGLYADAPTGFLLCNGQEVAIESFPELYAVIGKLEVCQSANEGMFKVPDLRGRVLEGADGNLGNRIEAGLPNIKGNVKTSIYSFVEEDKGAFSLEYFTPSQAYWHGVDNFSVYSVRFDASKSNPIYSDDCNTVQMPAVCVNYIIKY